MGSCDGCDRKRWLYSFTHTFPWGVDTVWLCGDCAGLYIDEDDEEALS